MDARVAFDDVLGGGRPEPREIINMAGETLRVLRRRRLRHARRPARFEILGFDPTAWSFKPEGDTVVGVDAGIPEGVYPLYDAYREGFARAAGKPKLVRIDGEDSYKEFRDLRRQPYLAELDARVRRLEKAFSEHLSDSHGPFGSDVDAFEKYLDGKGDKTTLNGDYDRAVIGAVAETARGGRAVSLGLPPSMRGKVECWVDGDEVLLSARTPYGIATTGAPLDEHVQEVVGAAEAAGCCGEDALLIGCHLAPRIAGLRLLGAICRSASAFEEACGRVDGPVVGVLTPSVDPGLTAMMALLQKCQQGDKRACREAHKMASTSASRLVRAAGARLQRAQQAKARVLRERRVIGMDGKEFGINFFGGAHTGGNILLHAFGAGQLGDKLTEVEAPALPGWAGGTADAKPAVMMPPPPNPKDPAKTINIVTKPDAVVVVHTNGAYDVVAAPATVGVLGGTRFNGNGYKRSGDQKFSFGYDAPMSVTVTATKGSKKVNATDVKQVMFQGGHEEKTVSV